MKPAENIEKLLKKMNVIPDAQTDRQTLTDILRAQEENKIDNPAVLMPEIWRIIMKKKTIPISIAVVIFLAILFSINPFEKQIPLTPIAFAEVVKSMEGAYWMHQISSGFERGVTGTSEQWFGMKDKIHIFKSADGQVTFWNIAEEKKYQYDPEKNVIQVYPAPESECPLNITSPALMLQSLHEMLIEQGAEIIVKPSEYNGQKVQLQEISLTIEGQIQRLELYVELESKRLIAAHITGKDAEGNILMDGKAEFTYLKTGPMSIYDLGVPREMPVKVLGESVSNPDPIIERIDTAESWPEPAELVRLYWKARHEKNYELTRLYWPHSEQWDEGVFKEEKPIEYVFGSPEEGWDDTTLFIPYDTEEYYKQNHKYRLKMILSRKSSQKGRYYIISGN